MTIHYTRLTHGPMRGPQTGTSARSAAARAVEPLTSVARFYQASGKRALDLVLTVLALPLVVPLVAVLAIIIAARDGANPFYSHPRLGRKGRVFRFWKLRTMVPDAEACLEAHLASCPEARSEWDHAQKLRHDPRITRFGAFLRKTSLDELPQLWNVLKGDMSLVGPRPMMLDQRPLYPGEHYESMRPGITGPWQVMARNNSSFAERARFDAHYHTRVSLVTDLRLLLATVGVVLRGTGY